ncbi:MAG: YbhB/YbcL family Raf kinase inhibitor-like protein [Actinomycetia bacterium]|nr:YbhB/YbcL family Raf kinase inhibitor-like protein [Actinomycetes bacterium]
MELWSNDFSEGDPIPGEFAFCLPDADTHATFGPNRNPHLAWSGTPEGTRSLAIVCHDPDVPTKPDDVNVEGREVPEDLPRTDFFHWVLLELSPEVTEIGTAACSDGVTTRGKGSESPFDCRQGINDYTGWFAGDEDMEGSYHGYDGPCPPWNDSLIHHYVFTVFALDTDSFELPESFGGAEARTALEGHVLDSATMTGTYTLNPRLS